jgi:hypothetical protein
MLISMKEYFSTKIDISLPVFILMIALWIFLIVLAALYGIDVYRWYTYDKGL